MANRETSQSDVVRRLIPADASAMVSIIETARREYGVQCRIQSVLEPLDLDLQALRLSLPAGSLLIDRKCTGLRNRRLLDHPRREFMHEIITTRADLCAGRDRVLDAALRQALDSRSP